MLELVDVGPRSLQAYCGVVPDAILDDPGNKGRERVREHFLRPRLLLNEMELMRELTAGRQVIPAEHRDPVCGMAVSLEEAAPEARYQNVTYRFCSDACREQFLREPKH